MYSSSLNRISWDSAEEKPWHVFELVAAMFARVVILDERVQSSCSKQVRGVTLWKNWVMAGIWIPFNNGAVDNDEMYHESNLVCNLDQPDFNRIKTYLESPTKLKRQLPADFLVIHLTILENLNLQRNTVETVSETLIELVKGTQVAGANIIIVTGRGMPAVASECNGNKLSARHLPISTLLEHLTTRPSKLGLMRALWAASSPI